MTTPTEVGLHSTTPKCEKELSSQQSYQRNSGALLMTIEKPTDLALPL